MECFLYIIQAFYAAMAEAQIERPQEQLEELRHFFRGVPKVNWIKYRHEKVYIVGEAKEDLDRFINQFILGGYERLHVKASKKFVGHLEHSPLTWSMREFLNRTQICYDFLSDYDDDDSDDDDHDDDVSSINEIVSSVQARDSMVPNSAGEASRKQHPH
jgi:hypothetical protein